MRSAPGLLSIFLIAAGVACAELPPDLPPATPLPLAPGPVIGGTIKGNPAAGVVPVRELIEANRRNENIPMAEPIPGETVSSIPQAEPIPNAEPIPGETNLHAPVQPAGPVPVIPPTAFSPVPVPQHETRVAILGYHDFSRTLPATEMRMNTDVFRAQMQALKASGVPVISMKEFLEWKLGSRQLPAKCVMITIDDGWKSVYTDAYPILKETGFPFTVFPYTKFITGRGSAMSHDQIQEMLDNGATLGSHSVSHLYPRSWRAAQRKGTQAVLDLATAEISNSRKILQEKFPGSAVEAYCYPGGFVLPDMITKAEEAGFQAAFTVIPKKVTKDTDRWRVHRYMVFGKDPKTFTRALNFNVPTAPETPSATPGNNSSSGNSLNSYPAPAQPVYPAANTVVKNQNPDISISLAREPAFDPKQVEMRVSGFGLVNAQYDPKEKILKWTPSRPLRLSPVTVQVRWKNLAANLWQTATWQFGIAEQEMHCIPQNVVK